MRFENMPERKNGSLIFVYGSLRRGSWNHYLLAGAEFVTNATVRGRLFFDGSLPYLVLPESAVEQTLVLGEIYRVSEGQLAGLDDLEGSPSFYSRVRVTARTLTGQQLNIQAYVWFHPPTSDFSLIDSGDFFDCQTRPLGQIA